MRESWDKAIEIVLRNEDATLSGEITNDAGGRTRWGIAEKYNPEAWRDGPPTLEQAKEVYLNSYWIPGGCDSLQYPMDIAMFDACVNPGIGAAQILLKNNPTLGSFMRARIRWYCKQTLKHPNLLQNLPGWTLRCLNLWRELEGV